MAYQSLDIVIRPDGLLLEWSDSSDRYPEASAQFQQDLFRHYHADSGTWLLLLGLADPALPLPPTLSFWRDFAGSFAEQLTHLAELEKLREKATVALEASDLEGWLVRAPIGSGSEYLSQGLLQRLWTTLHDAYRRLISAYDGSVEAFIHEYRPNLQLAGRVFFHLVENKQGESPFAFLATYVTHQEEDGGSRHLPLSHALQEYAVDQAKLIELLTTVYRASRGSELLPQLLKSGDLFHPLGWEPSDAYAFLREVPLYEDCGIRCRIPNWWGPRAAATQLTVNIGNSVPSQVGMEAILSMVPSLSVSGVAITPDEARALLRESDGLTLIKNKWVEIDRDKLQQTLAAYEQARPLLEGGFSLREALGLQLSPDKLLGEQYQTVDVGVCYGEWFEDVARKLLNPHLVPELLPASGFKASLRPYQQAGLNWLGFLDGFGFGACLADDMGLGKTIQVLAFLSSKQSQQITSLLVIPASLIANWCSEIDAFCPQLNYHIAHPSSGRPAQPGQPGQLALSAQLAATADWSRYDLVITTYGMAQRNHALQAFHWDYLILDEAQAIKNPLAKQTRAIKKLHAGRRIIMTGTPVENRLSDLWSLFDFLNPGLLGNLTEFKKFATKLKKDPAAVGRLRQVISPYILRRMKTDKTIIHDLPAKVEMKTFAGLSKKQTVLYRQLVDEISAALERHKEGMEGGIERRGLILASLLKFKQLCNHPDQFLGSGGFAEKDSGKFQRLREICETIRDKHEQLLLFTQFRELIPALHAFLAGVFGRDGIVLHGNVAVKQRKARIEAFQNQETYIPFMVLSLRAGGVGLNLTAANHVVHFDRWWNPAVENQATDRAFRIGQQKSVVVHKFITEGTIEEKIDAMIETKAQLAGEVVTTSTDAWITELGNDELLQLFRLGLS